MRYLLMAKLAAFLAALVALVAYVSPSHIDQHQIPSIAAVPIPEPRPDVLVVAKRCARWLLVPVREGPFIVGVKPQAHGDIACSEITTDDMLTYYMNGSDI